MSATTSNAVVAKARAIYGKRLSEADYTELVRRQSVSEVADYLKRSTHYREILSAVDTNTVHRGYLEDLLRKNTFAIYSGLCKFQQLDKIDFYRYDIVNKEIDQILRCILCLNTDTEDDYISSLPAYLIQHAGIDLLQLAKAKSFEDILAVIRHTDYYDVLKHVKPDANGKYDYTSCEVALRTYYLRWLGERVDKTFSGKTAKDLRFLILTQVDLINIINSYRMKTYFSTPADDIKASMLPFYGRLSEKKLTELYESPDRDEFLRRLGRTYYGRQIPQFEVESMEKQLAELRYKYAKITLRVSQSAPVSLYAIHFLFELEVENLISIIEGIRYKVPSGYIEKLLIK